MGFRFQPAFLAISTGHLIILNKRNSFNEYSDMTYSRQFLVLVLLIFVTETSLAQNAVDLASDHIIFDDFNYNSPAHLFSSNAWEVGPIRTRSTPMWRSYNWDDLAFDRGEIAFSNGVMTLNVPSGNRLTLGRDDSRSARLPAVIMGMALGQGTYGARVRFHHLDDENYLISSFWAGSPNRYMTQGGANLANELDLEFNSCFSHPGSRSCSGQANNLMIVSNWEDRTVESVHVDCYGATGSRPRYYANDCVYEGSSLFVDRWWNIIFTWDGEKVSYMLHSEAQGSSPVSWWASATGYEDPIILRRNLPKSDLVPQFLLKAAPDKSDNDDTDLDNPFTLDVDWFYYSPSIISSFHEYLSTIMGLKKDGHVRVNTTGYEFLDVKAINTPSSHDLTIRGPSEVNARAGGTWTISMPPRGGIYRLDFAYERRDESTERWLRPIQVDSRSISLSDMCGVDAVRISAHVSNAYNPTKTAGAARTIRVEQSGCRGS